MSEDVKPRKFYIQNPHLNICTWTKYSAYEPEVNPSIEDEIRAIELEPTLQLMKEMGEAIINEVRFDSKEEILEKYRKFLEWISK